MLVSVKKNAEDGACGIVEEKNKLDVSSRMLLLAQIWKEKWEAAAGTLRQLTICDTQLAWALGDWDDRRIGRMAQVALTGSSDRNEPAKLECCVKELPRLALIADRLHFRKFSQAGKLHMAVPAIAAYCGLAKDLATSEPFYTEQDLRQPQHALFCRKASSYDPNSLKQVMSLCAERADGLEASFRKLLPRPEPIAVAYVLTEGERGQEYRQRLLICSVRAFTQAQRRQLFQVMGSHSSGDSLLCSVLCCPKNIPLAHDMLRLLSAQKLLKLHLLTRSTWKKMGLRQVLFHSLRGRASVNLEADRNSQFTNCDQLVQVHIASFLNDRDLCAYRATCRSFYLNTRDYRRPADGLLGEAIAGMGPALPQVNLDLVKHLFSPTLRNDRGGYFRLAIATLPDEYLRRLPELLDWVPGELTDAVDCKHKWKDLANFNGIGLRLPISLMIRQCRQTNEQWELLGWLLSLQVYQAPAIDGLISAFVDADSLQRFDQVLERAEQPEMAARAHACLLKAKSGLFAAEGIE